MSWRDPDHLPAALPGTGPDVLLDDPADHCKRCHGSSFSDDDTPCTACDGTGYTREARLSAADLAEMQAENELDAERGDA